MPSVLVFLGTLMFVSMVGIFGVGMSSLPPARKRAIVLLLAGGLKALQTGAIALGLPFALIVVLLCISLVRALCRDARAAESEVRPPKGD